MDVEDHGDEGCDEGGGGGGHCGEVCEADVRPGLLNQFSF